MQKILGQDNVGGETGRDLNAIKQIREIGGAIADEDFKPIFDRVCCIVRASFAYVDLEVQTTPNSLALNLLYQLSRTF